MLTQTPRKQNRRSRSGKSMYLEALEPRQLMSTVMWTNGDNTHLWNDQYNWENEQGYPGLPSSDSDILIPAGVGGEIILENDVTVGAMAIGTGDQIAFVYAGQAATGKLTVNGNLVICAEANSTGLTIGTNVNALVESVLSFSPNSTALASVTVDGGALSTGAMGAFRANTIAELALIDATHPITTPTANLADTIYGALTTGGSITTAMPTLGTGSVIDFASWIAGSTGSGTLIDLTITNGGELYSTYANGFGNWHMSASGSAAIGLLNVPANNNAGGFTITSDGSNYVAVAETRNLTALGWEPLTLAPSPYHISDSGLGCYDGKMINTSAYVAWMQGWDQVFGGYVPGTPYAAWTEPSAGLYSNMNSHFPTVDLGAFTLNFGDPAIHTRIAVELGAVGCGNLTSSKLEVSGTAVLAGNIGDFLQCVRNPNTGRGPAEGEECCVLIADSGISGHFNDGTGFTGDTIGLEASCMWHAEVRNGNTELWIVNEGFLEWD